jgi:replicative DNA helicase
VRERSILRELIAAGDEIATTAFNREARPVGDIVDEAERKILAVGEATARGRDGFRDAAELVTELLDEVQRRADARTDELTGVRTGYHELDAMTAGLQRGDLVVLAARPSMGKTALALNIAENVAVKEELPVLVFSMEMGASQLTRRLAASRARINQQDLRAARLDDAGWSRLADAAEVIARAPLAIDATPGLSAAELRARARRQARKHGGPLGLIVIDYLQLMRGGAGSEDTRAAELGEISRSLKALAMEMDCPVLALSQLNRGVENRNEKRPVMSDLRDSGAIEQDADLIAFIYRDDYYNKDSKEPGIAELIVAKQRNGPLGTVKLAFLKPLTKFENLGP